jgi:hypothetical protein
LLKKDSLVSRMCTSSNKVRERILVENKTSCLKCGAVNIKNVTHGLCNKCYRYCCQAGGLGKYSGKDQRICPTAGCRRPISSRGVCIACYKRARRSGALLRLDKKPPRECTIDGCNCVASQSGLCNRHYLSRLRETMPLYSRWSNIKRKSVEDSWQSYEQFERDVGFPPTEGHELFRVDDTKPFGPTNVVWMTRRQHSFSKLADAYNLTEKPGSEEFVRELLLVSKKSPRTVLSNKECRAALARTNNICEICECPETLVSPSGKIKKLSLDHDHSTGKIRGWICNNCNATLGLIKDSAERAIRIAEYLVKYEDEPW